MIALITMLPATQHKEVVNKFKEFLSTQKGFSAEACKRYEVEILRLYSYRDILKLTEYSEVSDLILQVKRENNHSRLTTYKIVSILKVYYDFAQKFGYAFKDGLHPLYFGHEFKKGQAKEPEYFDRQQEADLVNKIIFHSSNSFRDSVILKLLFSTGLRRKELCDLNVQDVKDGLIHVRHGKGDKERWVPLSAKAQEMLDKWIRESGVTDYLFGSRKGGRIKPKAVWQMMTKLGRRLGIHLYPHKIRHSLPSFLLNKGMELTEVSQILGHSDTRTTLRYTHRSPKTLKEAYQKAMA